MSAGETAPVIPWMKIKLLTVHQVANWAQVSMKTVYRWIKNGELKSVVVPIRSLQRLLRPY